MIFFFWSLLFLIVYCYFGYPALIWLAARVCPRRVLKARVESSVSVVLSVWNEEDVIEEKIKNLLSLDYPKVTVLYRIMQ